MDTDFHDLLTRYVNGKCTPAEIEKINRWYQEIGDKDLELNEDEIVAMRRRILLNIQGERKSTHRSFPVHSLLRVAAAMAAIAVFAVWLFLDYRSEDDETVAEYVQAADNIGWENQTDSRKRYTLPDGSLVELAPSAKIYFSRSFSSANREVYLTGQAFFDIVEDASHPFHVYSGGIAIKVLGTSFFVDAPKDAARVGVKVVTGRVSVFPVGAHDAATGNRPAIKHPTTNGVVLSPNQTVEYFAAGGHWVTGLVEDPVPLKSIGGTDFSFVFANSSLKDIFSDINERYGIEVVTENEKINNCTFTGDVSRMSLYDMLDVISNSIGSTYEVKGTRILVSGKGCD